MVEVLAVQETETLGGAVSAKDMGMLDVVNMVASVKGRGSLA